VQHRIGRRPETLTLRRSKPVCRHAQNDITVRRPPLAGRLAGSPATRRLAAGLQAVFSVD